MERASHPSAPKDTLVEGKVDQQEGDRTTYARPWVHTVQKWQQTELSGNS